MVTTWMIPAGYRLESEDIDRLTRGLERTAQPCGCKSGAALTLGALVGWPVHVATTSGLPRTPTSVGLALVTYAVVVLGAAVGGKLAGIVVGRKRHRRLQHRLSQRLSAQRAC